MTDIDIAKLRAAAISDDDIHDALTTWFGSDPETPWFTGLSNDIYDACFSTMRAVLEAATATATDALEAATALGLLLGLEAAEAENAKLRKEADLLSGGLFLLRKAVEADDPKAELLIRISDMEREIRAALASTTPAKTEEKAE